MDKKILITTAILILLIGSVYALNVKTIYNPFTGKLDYILNDQNMSNLTFVDNLNMTGHNITNIDTLTGNGDNIRIGDAGTDSHSLTTDDDLFVSGKLEVDGISYFDGIMNIADNILLRFGSSNDFLMSWETTQSLANTFLIQTDSVARSIIIGEKVNDGKDYDHPAQSNPTIFIQSVTNPDTNNTQWISMTHDQTDAVIDSGTSSIVLDDNTRVSGNISSGDSIGNLVVDMYDDGSNFIIDTTNEIKLDNNLTFSNGGKIGSYNSTCVGIWSPDGSTITTICNA